jgi:hypothetical protein
MASHTSASASVEASDRPLSCSNRRIRYSRVFGWMCSARAARRAGLRGLAGMRLVGADVVEVAPAYDHAEMTTVAAAHVAYELLALMLLGR